jgi:hypothetical protein
MIYEIKNINDVKDKKNKTDFIKGIYKTTNDSQLRLFFQQETHEATKEKLRVEELNTVNKELVKVSCKRSRNASFEDFNFKVNNFGFPQVEGDLYDILKDVKC